MKGEKADLIIHNANILAVDSKFSTAKTMAIADGKLIYIGNSNNIAAWQDSSTRVIDIKGHTVLPGFIEPHTHPITSATLYEWIDVSGATHGTAKKAIRHLKKALKEIPAGQWVLAFGWDFMQLEGAIPLTKDYLDEHVSDKHPVWVMMQSMHTSYFNSLGLQKGGITKNTPNPLGGGYYEKNDLGELTGVTTETATVMPMVATLPKMTNSQAKILLDRMYRRYNSSGITTIGATGMIDLMSGVDAYSICKELSEADPLPIRLYYYNIGTGTPATHNDNKSNNQLELLGQKYWVDGSPYTGSMLLREPYLSSVLNRNLGIKEGSQGHAMFEAPYYQKFFKSSIDSNFQLSVHVQGDSAVQLALNSLSALKSEGVPIDQRRHRFEHLALVTEAQLSSMKSMNITPSFHINHIYYYGDSLASSIIGSTRAERLMPLKSALQRGHKLTLHNDSPMYRPNPLLSMRTAITRLTKQGLRLGPEEGINIEEAIRAVTINAAWQLHAEDVIGSLELGKRADFVILDKNPTQIPATDLDQIRILATFIDGQKVL